MLMDDNVRPRSGSSSQRADGVSAFEVKCAASIATQPSASTNPPSESRAGSGGLNTFRRTTALSPPVCATVSEALVQPFGTSVALVQFTVTHSRWSLSTAPIVLLSCSHGTLDVAVKVNGALPRLK